MFRNAGAPGPAYYQQQAIIKSYWADDKTQN
jgi:hypothetical protein